MRRVLALLVVLSVLVPVFALSVNAVSPDYTVSMGSYGLYSTNTTNWTDPGNTSISGDLSTYYQWFYTYYPIYSGSVYSSPILIYTYDGSMLDGQNPTTRYCIRITEGSDRSVYIEYGRMSASNVFSRDTTLSYVFGTHYSDLIAFCGWGMDNNGQLYVLVMVDGQYTYQRLASSPNGDTHLYAAPNRFNDFYILGFNTAAFKSYSISSTLVINCHRLLMSRNVDTAVYRSWISYLERMSDNADPADTNHFFNIYLPKDSLNLGQQDWSDLLNPSVPAAPSSPSFDAYELVSSVSVSVSDQASFVRTNGSCVYVVTVQQVIKQYYGIDDLDVSYSVLVQPDDGSSNVLRPVLTYGRDFTSSFLFDRLTGVTLRPGTSQYAFKSFEYQYSSTVNGSLIYECTDSIQLSFTYEAYRTAQLNLYLVSDGSSWSTYSDKSDYIEKLQQSFYDKYVDSINQGLNDYSTYSVSIEMGDAGSIFDTFWSLPGVLTLLTFAATVLTAKVVLL